jgi:hypothetical protein
MATGAKPTSVTDAPAEDGASIGAATKPIAKGETPAF